LPRGDISGKDKIVMNRTLAVIVLLLVMATVALWLFKAGAAPEVSIETAPGPVSSTGVVSLSLKSRGAPLKLVSVTVTQGTRTVKVLDRHYPGETHSDRTSFTLSEAGLAEGEFTLLVKAGAASVLPFGAAIRTFPMHYEDTPLKVTVLSAPHYIRRGGAALMVYSLTKAPSRSGVVVGTRFFPGQSRGGGYYACLYPWPSAIAPADFQPVLLVADRYGYQQQLPIKLSRLDRSFPADRINVTQGFLDTVAGRFKGHFPGVSSPLEIFLQANRQLREENNRTLHDYGRLTAPAPLWQGAFLRLPGAAMVGDFAQARSYLFQGREIDRQVHQGVDLASLAGSHVPAANGGKVVFAGELGLYGQCVIIDHGLGLQTVYGHLGSVAVKAGDAVVRGAVIGNTGTTGMAVGDHLHFEVALSGQQVDPYEWWDKSWLRNNIESKLQRIPADAKQQSPQ
jgi:murein DD-endopeptidase MepM/ murein hydrolase activator NlpD